MEQVIAAPQTNQTDKAAISTVPSQQERNENLIAQLALVITLKGHDFDGILNFGAVEVVPTNGKPFLLDIITTQGYNEFSEGQPVLKTYSTFESLTETILMFSDDYDYDFEQPLAEILPHALLRTNLNGCDAGPDDEVACLVKNVARVCDMRLVNLTTEQTIGTVVQDDSL
ncbi:hypothetical protein [Vibrio sp. 10N.261.52.A1]|uniref:hypothetical protein n=1 Tax=Vibrio TaxID=662 RepID=UPI000C81C5AA|nr:hypothetical protein [Vibrio sp. 10N.261.52.A1]PML64741.1 hypothetical protein BCT81_06745 [Vibrio sp. 10N.261.52.A1]